MILRRISVERYGRFGTAEFEFRRGLNLVFGNNDSGKTLLLRSLPAILLGEANGARLRSWGDSLSCRGTLLFEDGDRQVRIQRDLENDLVRIEEKIANGKWQELFNSQIPVNPTSPPRLQYFGLLQRLFGVEGEVLLRALLDPAARQSLLDDDGHLTDGLFASKEQEADPLADAADEGDRQNQIASLEAEVATDAEEYRKGEEYLAWIRRRWEKEAGGGAKPKKAGNNSKDDGSALMRERDELAGLLRKQGLPLQLPADIDEMFVTAEGLRQELAGLQLEVTPLQRSRQEVDLPGVLWPIFLTLLAIAPPAVAFWLKTPWLIASGAGSIAFLILVWGISLTRRNKAKKIIDNLEEQLGKVELKRADALARQEELAEHFALFNLPSSPVEMVKLQQLCQRNAETIKRYRLLSGQQETIAGQEKAERGDGHLRPEDLPEAEAKLAALGESLREREVRLQMLREGKPLPAARKTMPVDAVQRRKLLLQAVNQQMDRLTGGRFRELRLEEGLLRLETAPGRWAAPSACGRGTADTLLLSLRMALGQLTGSFLPLTVDDLPTRLDVHRSQAILHALERFASGNQVILTTNDEELAKRAVRERWTLIDLNLPERVTPKREEEGDNAGQLHLL